MQVRSHDLIAKRVCQSSIGLFQSAQDGKVTLIAQREIKKGEEMTIAYIDNFQGECRPFLHAMFLL